MNENPPTGRPIFVSPHADDAVLSCGGTIAALAEAGRRPLIATHENHSVQEFCEVAFARVGLDWRKYVHVDSAFVRPAEVDVLIGDASKARHNLGWRPTVTFRELVELMVDADLERLRAAGR